METYGFDTLQLHAGQEPDSQTHARAVPIYQTSAYVFESAEKARAIFELKDPHPLYTRVGNPTTEVLEKRLAALEGGSAAVALASGMAAVYYAVLNVARAGDEIVALNTLYGGTHTLFHNRLEYVGITVRLVPPEDLAALEAAINEKTKAVYIETLGNPNINIPDIQAICDLAHRHGIVVIADNTFGTPYLIRSRDFGVDVVVHSMTKYIDGHGTSIGGAIVDLGTFDWHNPRYPGFTEPDPGYHGLVYADLGAGAFATRARVTLLRDTGACLSPFNAFLLLNGIETLSLRMERHCRNAEKIAAFLAAHPAVEQVHYPALPGDPYHERAQRYFPKGVGGILSFDMKGGYEAGSRLIDKVRIFSNLANVGDAKSLINHSASTTHSQLDEESLRAAGISPGCVRLSVGLEDIEDLLADLRQAME